MAAFGGRPSTVSIPVVSALQTRRREAEPSTAASAEFGQLFDPAIGIAQLLERNAHLVQNGRTHIAQRGRRIEYNVTATLDLATAAAQHQNRQVIMVVDVAVTDARAVQ